MELNIVSLQACLREMLTSEQAIDALSMLTFVNTSDDQFVINLMADYKYVVPFACLASPRLDYLLPLRFILVLLLRIILFQLH